jgi:superfamily II DNA or RNA helicase
MDPRDAIQDDLLERARQLARNGVREVLIQLPTGGGKGVMITKATTRCVAACKRALVIVPLIVLAEDMHRRHLQAGIRAGLVQADNNTDPDAWIQIATMQTLAQMSPRPAADLVIVDEARHAASDKLRALLAEYQGANMLGFDATPERQDGKPLGDIFRAIVQGPSVKELQRLGALVPCEVLALADKTRQLAADPIEAYLRHTPNTRAIVFASDVAHASEIEQRATAEGLTAAVIVGTTSRRERERLLNLDPQIIVGVGVMREGWDRPQVETVVLARAFDHVSGWLQCIGRGLRIHPGKTRCTVLDLAGSVHLLGLPDEDRTWHLEGAAARRTENALVIRRCLECGCVYREAAVCPRCGATASRARKVKRVLSAAERMSRIEAVEDPVERDKKRFAALVKQAFSWAPPGRATHIARAQFVKKYGRAAPL